MNKINQLDIISSYSDNSIWDKLFLVEFSNTKYWNEQLSQIVPFIESEIQSIVDSKTSWKNTFLKFKKLCSFADYFVNFIHIYKSMNKTSKTTNEFLDKASEVTDEMWTKVTSNEEVIKKFRQLQNITKSSSKKVIIADWLKNLFDAHQNGHKKNQYNKHYSKLQSSIEDFNAHNDAILKSTKSSIFVNSSDKEQLIGIPGSILKVAKKNATAKGLNGWLFYISEHNILSVCANAKNREFRERAYKKYQSTHSNGQHITKNNAIIKKIMLNKHNIANVLNKTNYADLVISNHLLNTKHKVNKYLDKMELGVEEKALEIISDMKLMAKADNVRKLKPWDYYYYFAQLEKKHKNKSVKFKEYFSFNDAFPKIIDYFEKQLHLKFELISHDKKDFNSFYYKITDKNTGHIMHLIFSPFEKANRSGCYQYDISTKAKFGNETTSSVQYIECDINVNNFSFFELSCLIHEFGHAFHSFLSKDEDAYSKNVSYSWDLIEMPSQFLEFLVFDYNFMKKISKKPISKQNFLSLISAEQYFEAYHIYRNIKRNRIIFNTYLNFRPYSQTNIHAEVTKMMEQEGIIYNISQDSYMSYDNYLSDYAPVGYIYLLSAQIAQKIERKDIRFIFDNLFNSSQRIGFKDKLNQFVDISDLDINSHINKELPIYTY